MRHDKKTIVIKLGTSSICDEHSHEPLISNLSLLVETATRMRRDGHRVVIVSSGGIAMGLRRMDLPRRPKELAKVQALAAIGQCRLIALWDELFQQLRQPVAQILLTRNDIVDRSQYLNAKNTLRELLHMNVIPIVNENDTLAVSEIKFGDNDTLSAITAAMVQADYLFLMTDVDCLYTDNPRTNPDATPIEEISDFATLKADVSSAGSSVGTGGMYTKITAAKLASSAGVTTIITRGSVPSNMIRIVDGLSRMGAETQHMHAGDPQLIRTGDSTSVAEAVMAPRSAGRPSTGTTDSSMTSSVSSLPDKDKSLPLHTRFLPLDHPVRDRHIWLLHGLHPEGRIVIDAGAYRALTRRNKAGLLPAGIVEVQGNFSTDSCVALCVEVETVGSIPGAAVVLSEATTPVSGDTRPSTSLAIAASDGSLLRSAAMLAAAQRELSTNQDSGEATPETPAKPQRLLKEVGRALTNYSSLEIDRIKRHHSHNIAALLGYSDTEYVAHRDNLAFYKLA